MDIDREHPSPQSAGQELSVGSDSSQTLESIMSGTTLASPTPTDAATHHHPSVEAHGQQAESEASTAAPTIDPFRIEYEAYSGLILDDAAIAYLHQLLEFKTSSPARFFDLSSTDENISKALCRTAYPVVVVQSTTTRELALKVPFLSTINSSMNIQEAIPLDMLEYKKNEHWKVLGNDFDLSIKATEDDGMWRGLPLGVGTRLFLGVAPGSHSFIANHRDMCKDWTTLVGNSEEEDHFAVQAAFVTEWFLKESVYERSFPVRLRAHGDKRLLTTFGRVMAKAAALHVLNAIEKTHDGKWVEAFTAYEPSLLGRTGEITEALSSGEFTALVCRRYMNDVKHHMYLHVRGVFHNLAILDKYDDDNFRIEDLEDGMDLYFQARMTTDPNSALFGDRDLSFCCDNQELFNLCQTVGLFARKPSVAPDIPPNQFVALRAANVHARFINEDHKKTLVLLRAAANRGIQANTLPYSAARYPVDFKKCSPLAQLEQDLGPSRPDRPLEFTPETQKEYSLATIAWRREWNEWMRERRDAQAAHAAGTTTAPPTAPTDTAPGP